MLRFPITRGVGRQLAVRYGIRAIPALVLLDGEGDVILKQAGMLNAQAVKDAVAELPLE